MSPLPAPPTGIIPPVCTPLTEECEIDLPSLRRLIQFHLDNGVHGLFVLGSTSETVLLTNQQRATVIETAVKEVAGRVPVVAGLIDFSTARCLENARIAKELGVDGVVLTAPFYIRPSQSEIVIHFRAIRDEIGLPILAYDIPGAVHVKIEPETVRKMAVAGIIAGIKDSSGSDIGLRRVILATREIDGFGALAGSEVTTDIALFMGASGAVPGLGNVDPAGYVRLYNAVKAGDLATARREQERLCRLFEIVQAGDPARMGFTASALGAFKTALVLRGVIATNVTGRPMTRLNEAEAVRVRAILEETGVL